MSSDDQNLAESNEASDDEDLKRSQLLRKEPASTGGERGEGGNNNAPGDVASLHTGSSGQGSDGSQPSAATSASSDAEKPRATRNVTENTAGQQAASEAVPSKATGPENTTPEAQSVEAGASTVIAERDGQLEQQDDGITQASAADSRADASDAVRQDSGDVSTINGAQAARLSQDQDNRFVDQGPVAADNDQTPDDTSPSLPDTVDRNEAPIDIGVSHQFASGREQQANSHDAGYQSTPAIAALEDGGYVVTWTSSGQDGSGYGIYGQRYDSDGNQVGDEFQANSYTASHQNAPAITALSDGGYVVSWTSNGQDGSSYGIFGQRFDADGNAVGDEFQANATSQGYQYSPTITGLEGGGFVVSWSSYSANGSSYDIHAQRYDAEGRQEGGEFLINSQTEGYQFTPAITSLADGGFVTTWSSYNPSDRSYDVYGQRFDADGEAVGDEMLINSQTEGYQFSPSIVGMADGGFVATWSSYQQGSSAYDVQGQRFDADGHKVGEEFQVNTHTSGLQYDPSITSLADGGFMVTWTSSGQDGSGYGVFAQRFDAEGQAVGDEFQVNDHGAGHQNTPAVTALQDGSVVVTWGSNDAGDADVMHKVYHQGVAENAADGTVVMTVTATDPDGDRLTYSLADNADGRFAIDAETGLITVADGTKLDYESASSHNIVVRVTDSEGASSEKAINIDLADRNEAPIDLAFKSESIVEDAANGTVVGSASATDQDANETFTYSLTDDAAGRFAINAETGEITVADTSKIDYESDTSHSVTVQVTDSAGNTRTEEVSFEITNAVGDDIKGTGSDDRLYGTSEEEKLYGGAGNDTIIAGDGDDLLEGGAGNDYLRGDAGDDTLRGGEGNDRLYAGDGDDTLDGGDGTDYLYAGDGDDTLLGGTGNDYLRGDAGNDVLDGGEGNDSLLGGTGEDVIDAGSGNDSVYGGAGADVMDGGEGLDFLRYDQSSEGVQVDLGRGTASGGDAEGDKFSNFERLVGSAHDDTLTGDDGDNYFYGRAGDDRIDGGAGRDYLIGEDGDDTLLGGEGNDYLRGDAGNDVLDGGEGNDSLLGGAGEDVIDAGSGNDSVYGGAGADVMDGGEGLDFLRYDQSSEGVQVDLGRGTASGGDAEGDKFSNFERLVGSAHDDTLTGDDGDNYFYGRAGDDRIDGGAGRDYLIGEDGDDTLLGGTGNDYLRGDAGNDVLDGGDGNDSLLGGTGDDVIDAGSGNDSVYGGAGADKMDGGEGLDFLRYDRSSEAVQVDLGAGTASGGDAEGDKFSNFERLVGSAHDDTLTGDDGDNYFYGRAGDDRIDGGAGRDYLIGEDGDDTLLGGEGNDYLRGDAGNDVLDAGEGNDRLYGGDGTDRLSGGDGNDYLYGQDGNDALSGGDGNDYLLGGAGEDVIEAGSGNDSVYGGAGADVMDGGEGLDFLRYDQSSAGVQVDLSAGTASGGDAEGDTFSNFERVIGSAHDDTLTGDDGDNYFYGRAGDDRIDGGAGNDYLIGEDGDDALIGGEGNDYLRGDAGNDVLDGGDGTDRLYGGDGIDRLSGGADNDYLYGQDGNDALSGGDGNDYLYGGSGEDVIDAGAGNDSVFGGVGADRMDGGEGIDYLRYDQSSEGVQVDLGRGTGSGGDAEGDSFSNFERVIGSAHDDTVTGDDGANYIYSRAGDDRVDGGAGNDYLIGEDGNDTLLGGTGNDYLRGDAGNDVLDGGEGTDRLYGGDGDDRLSGGADNDYLYGQDGNDALSGGDGNDYLLGGDGDDTLQGGAGNDYLDGGAGDDLFILMQGQGNDRISGGQGDAWTDIIELQNDGGSIGEYGTDWTVALDSGEVKGSNSDGNGSWLELTDDASGTITMQDGTEFSFDGIEHICW